MILNHMGLAVTDVLATAAMFEKYFDFSRVRGPFNAEMAFLTDGTGALMTLFKTDDAVYPEIFHIGFMLEAVEEVLDIHARLTDDGFEPEQPREEYGRFTFYFKAPGGFVVEVNTHKKPILARPSA